MVFDVGRILSLFIVIVLFMMKKRIPTLPVWIIFVLEGIIIFSTLINDGDVIHAILWAGAILALLCIIDFFSTWPQKLIGALMLNLEWLIYFNLFSILAYPDGMYIRDGAGHYFLGYRNGFFRYVLLALCVGILYARYKGTWIRSFSLIAAGIISIILTWSATSFSALLLIGVLMLLSSHKFRNWFSYTKMLSVMLIADLLISVFRVMDRSVWIAWAIERALRRQITLTGRIFIWDQFYELFAANPIWGYGVGLHISVFSRPMTAHNQYFNFLLIGGVFSLILFMIFMLIIGKKLDRYHEYSSSYLFISVLAGLYMIFIAEAYNNTPIVYAIMMMAYKIDKFSMVPEFRYLKSQK